MKRTSRLLRRLIPLAYALLTTSVLALTTVEPVGSWPLLPTRPAGNEFTQHPSNGWLYGTCSNGGAHGYGMIFRMNASTIEPLVHFTGEAGMFPGETPFGKLVLGADGNFYGTTAEGGSFFGGTIFRMTSEGVFTTLVEFTGQGEQNQGRNPSELTLGADGNFYGTTLFGGTSDNGTFFKVTPAGVLTTLYHYSGTGGSRVTGRLTRGANGNFYGATYNDGALGFGTIFMMTPAGVPTTLLEFTLNGEENKGAFPGRNLVLHTDGKFYGVTQWGPTGTNGSVFSMTADGTLTTIAELDFDGSHGANPGLGLTSGADGRLYGTTPSGGTFDLGTLFAVTTEGDLETLLHFTGNGASNKGSGVAGSLTLGSDGNLHGMTSAGGLSNNGTLFSVTHAGVLTTRLNCTQTGSGPEGASPSGKLTRGADDNFYGMTRLGGSADLGTVFRLTPAGERTVLVSFTGTSGLNLGAHPVGSLLLGADGNFYGMTPEGGASDLGTIFRMTAEGALTTLVSFTGDGASNKGSFPQGSLIQTPGGTFYGTTSKGGASDYGTVFAMTSAGVLSTLLQFTGFEGAAPGSTPYGDLLLGPDNKLYGTTSGYDITLDGSLFSVTTAGVFTTLLDFNVSAGLRGSAPLGALILGKDGRLYGLSSMGGNVHDGALYAISLSGQYERLFTFDTDNAVNNGAFPAGTLTPGHDDRFYGTTAEGGAAGKGTLFAFRNGGLKTLVDFTGLGTGAEIGAGPQDGRLTSAADGSLFGLTRDGGAGGGGSIFRLIAGPEITVTRPGHGVVAHDSEIEFFFGVPVGSGADLTLTITNSGAKDLEDITATFTGTHASDFSLVTAPQATMVPGASTSLVLRFTPGALGARAGSLEISSSDDDQDPFVVNFSGSGVAPISFSAPAYTVNHGASEVVVTLTRPTGTEAGSVTLQTADGTTSKVPPFSAGVAGKDYTSVNVDVEFDIGQTSKQVSIPLNPNSSSAANKRFIANIFDPEGSAALGNITAATIEILATDTTKPTVTITAPAAKTSDVSPFLAKGMTGDAKGIDRVEVELNGNPVGDAILGNTSSPTSVPWSLAIVPLEGANTITVTAFDARGNFTAVTRTFTFSRRHLLTLTRSNPAAGAVSLAATPAANASALSPTAAASDPKTSSIVAGAAVKLTATPKAGFVFDQWLGLPMGSSRLGNVVSFTMPANNVAITAQFVATPFGAPAGRPNTFFGLLHDITPPATNGSEGFLTGTLTATGGFTGKLFVDGVAQTVNAAFFGDGSSVFTVGAAKQISLTFGGRTLTLAFDFADQSIEATLVKGAVFSSGAATRPLYSSTNKVPVALLSSAKATKGFYTAVFPAKTQAPPVDLTSYPQGNGFATMTLANSGAVSIAGTLADGTAITGSSALLTGNTAPFLVQLPTAGASAVKGGSFSGTLTFDTTPADSDVTAANLLWFRAPAVGTTAATYLYTPGWPDGIRVDAVGALYNTTTKVQATLGLGAPHATNGNGQLMFTDGKLTAPITKTNFNINGNTVAKIPTSDATFMVTLAAATGGFSGSFVPNWANPNAAKPAFKGILIQKGASKGGFGFFISNAKNDLDPESGGVTLGAP